MHSTSRLEIAQNPRRLRRIMAVAWLLIVVKSLLVWWAVGHWHTPFNPFWVIGPTLLFAALATAVWLTNDRE